MKMKTAVTTIVAATTAAFFASSLCGAEPTPAISPAASAAQPNEKEMMKQMMEMAKPGENQKLLDHLAGNWNYKVQMWMAPGAPPVKSSGTATVKSVMGGRYFITNASSQMHMPGPDGKMQAVPFKGMGIDGYDNVKQKFVSAWIDNMGTGILMSQGTYDAESKTFTYTTEEEMTPGSITKARESIKVVDKDHYTFEWYEEHGGQEVKTMEINYTRAK